jgi:flagellar hook-associated protein 1 FlgK
LQVRQDGRAAQDPGLDSQIHQTLEDLSEYVDFGVLKSDKDGSLTVNLGGQNPITIGGEFRPIQLDTSSASVRVLDQTGNDITSQIQGGRLRGALDVRNNLIPSLQSQVNQLASSMADAINSTLRNGIDVNKASPTTDLFQYDPNFPARTLSVTNIQPDELAAADPSAPGGNANALALANLGSSKQISDYSFSQFYGYIASQVGTALSGAKNAQKGQQLLLTQAKSLRSEASDVSLDEEASSLIAYQRAYQANAELVNILNSLTETTIGILR